MGKPELDEMKRDAEEWKTHWGVKMEAGRSQAMATSLLNLVTYTEEQAAAQDELKKQILQMHIESFQAHSCEFLVSQNALADPSAKCCHTVTVLGETHVRKSQYWLCEAHGKQWADEDDGILVPLKEVHGPYKRVLLLLEAYSDV